MPSLSVVIIGAGIGGLASAVLLKRSGHDVAVVERSPAFLQRRNQAGVALMANAMRCVEYMGLGEDLKSYADPSTTSSIINFSDAKVMANEPHRAP